MAGWVYRRPFHRVWRPKIPLFKVPPPVVRWRRRARALRAILRARRVVVLGRAAGTGHVAFVRLQAPATRQVRRVARHAILPSVPAFVGVSPAMKVHQAIARYRRQAERRRRWQPEPEEIPAFDRVEQTMKGRLFEPGLQRGRIVRG